MVSANEKLNIVGGTITGTTILAVTLAKFSAQIQPGVTAAIAAAALTFIGSILFMNKGAKWIVNLLGQTEPFLFSLGIGLFTLAPLTTNGIPLIIVSTAVTGIALLSRYTELLNL